MTMVGNKIEASDKMATQLVMPYNPDPGPTADQLHAELRTIFKKLESQHGKLALLVSSMEMGCAELVAKESKHKLLVCNGNQRHLLKHINSARKKINKDKESEAANVEAPPNKKRKSKKPGVSSAEASTPNRRARRKAAA
ncbi:unnamed protein product [Symbiodinium pilosum]|uniref:Uncharacterized protein n=1 Tax=Symbiodinium pilosum TaxID=2952 RepID=A0A812TYD6_SYMPI|nr:unnamed protein product [Symbiodinium pilosum]